MVTSVLVVLWAVSFGTSPIDAAESQLFSSEFIWDFFKASFDDRRNLAVSPFSIRSGMTLLASTITDGYTLKQMIDKLHLPNTVAKASEQYRRKLLVLHKDKYFRQGSKLLVFGSASMNPKFLLNAANFNTSIERHQRQNLKAIPTLVNRWAKEITHGMVNTLLMDNDLLPDTRMALVSATAFACNWEHQFSVNSTNAEMFDAYTTSKLYMTNLMHLQPTLLPVTWNDDLKMQAIALPFKKGSDYSFMVLMPLERDGNMTEMVMKLNQTSFKNLYDDLTEMRISVKLPRFTVSTSVNAKTILKKLHLTAPFQWSTFQIFDQEKLSLDKVKQSVTVQVDEEGVRAAAANKFNLVSRSAPLSFEVDRPFVFAILKNSIRFPLFVGHYAYPAKTTPIKA